MNAKTRVAILAGICAALAAVPAAAEAQAAKPQAVKAGDAARYKVVLQVSDGDPKKWHLALNNARNIQAELGKDNVDIEIVAYGPGIGMLKFDSEVANRLSDAVSGGMKVVACENTVTSLKLTKADMNSAVGYVRAGVVEIMQRQREGWAYIRP